MNSSATVFSNPNVLMVVRYVLMTLGGFLAGKGLIPTAAVSTAVEYTIGLLGAVVTFATFAWGLYTNRESARIAQVANLPSVVGVVTTSRAAAEAAPAPNVASANEVATRGLNALGQP